MTLEVSVPNPELEKIKKRVLDKTGFNLSYFKPTFLSRRINVRMKVLNITNGSEYADLLKSESDEILSLYDSISINVTKFFRDKQVWNTFSKNIVPKLFDGETNKTIRIWSAGCATGEEPYSIAIMLQEYLKDRNYKIKIIATDINSHFLTEAKKGIFSISALQNLNSNLIEKYFSNSGRDQYIVNKKIKDMITFQLGDIGTHPVSYLDVVFCRNLLIYYNSNAQDLILNKFYQTIKENKFLILGMDESLLGNKNSKNFIPLFPRERIYQKRSSTDQLSLLISNGKREFLKERVQLKRSSTDQLSTFISQRNQNKK